ncbi:AbrB/MazE/SpoVT family DNA-binding domain-containing protein [Rickettsiales endosymbiont of Stachyamoeba lipophora]|uniref:AbrB/MazE/SpoVT family DNA-binding domain-containing protein n=1 Tax=Rickettsiales endosymbiont of Stachyamoeba lipophora TaxID=2486578 RepID=UPI000F654548|nr:type II toxin-antitoxin system PrlF family antitoxin [Rickettsiales endosymbiont of Stachyamoeba lipophora]AZL16311.1 AbrB family transcriptional regulator [Rickettsiales endosymbiont of Stachyamoeba lipophora]
MNTSNVTQKFQATVPLSIRKHLGINSGDKVAYEIIDGKVILSKFRPLDVDFIKSVETTLSEWQSDNDDEAYRDL